MDIQAVNLPTLSCLLLRFPLRPRGADHTCMLKKLNYNRNQILRKLREFIAACMDGALILHDRWPGHRLSKVARKWKDEKSAPHKLVDKSINEATIVTDIYLIVLICLYCISFHYGEKSHFHWLPTLRPIAGKTINSFISIFDVLLRSQNKMV